AARPVRGRARGKLARGRLRGRAVEFVVREPQFDAARPALRSAACPAAPRLVLQPSPQIPCGPLKGRPRGWTGSHMTVAELDPRVQDVVGKTGKLLIDGHWVEAVSGKTFETFDPATEQRLGSIAHGEA